MPDLKRSEEVSMEKYVKTTEQEFEEFRRNTVGYGASIPTACGVKNLVYADWIASGRLYAPIEARITNDIGPFVANTHTESTHTGKTMTRAYRQALDTIKEHVNAGEDDVIITTGTGMTDALAKLQRILGLIVPERFTGALEKDRKPVVFITHMEHHSNHISWFESIAEVIIIPPGNDMRVDLERVENTVSKYRDRSLKIGCFTACSNVTGIRTPIHEMAKIMHKYEGVCFADYAANAPYDEINMHPADPSMSLDAIFFSPHKFLGGPGSSGVLIFNRKLYKNRIPDIPGGGTVNWTNPWGEHSYIKDIETREDGGTPGFLQAIRAALAIRLKEKMQVEKIHQRENELLRMAFDGLRRVPGLKILAGETKDRLGVISFYVEDVHFNLIIALLNDRFGIQVRGGCSCAGTYGHYLLNVDQQTSHQITSLIDQGDLSRKPGWVRLSLHPTMTDQELEYIIDALTQTVDNIREWEKDYRFDPRTAEYRHKGESRTSSFINNWFNLSE